jgi:hypothetical protein
MAKRNKAMHAQVQRKEAKKGHEIFTIERRLFSTAKHTNKKKE